MNRIAVACFVVLTLASCAGAKLSPDTARDAIARDLGLSKKQVDAHAISQLANTATIDASLKLTFILQKGTNNEWHIYKIQSSRNEWQTPDQFQNSLRNAFLAELKR